MSRNPVEDFGAYRDACRLFDLVVEDMVALQKDSRCYRLVGQQVGSADSICANLEEGFGRLSRAEFIRFLDISRGSARETLGRYKRMKHWLSDDVLASRVDLADKIVATLTKAINTLRAIAPRDTRHAIRESHSTYGTSRHETADALTEEDIAQVLML